MSKQKAAANSTTHNLTPHVQQGLKQIFMNLPSETVPESDVDTHARRSAPGYAPPEQFMGQPRLNSDIYALGMIAIQALTGKPTTNLERDSTTALVWRHIAETTAEFAAILDKMVCFDFQKRYQSAEEVLQRLENL